MKHDKNVRRMGVLAVACAVQFACGGGEHARDRQTDADEAGVFGDRAEHVQVTGCVERGIIPGSYMLSAVRIDAADAGLAETRGTSGETPEGSAAAMGDSDARPRSEAAYSTAESYTLRAVDGTNLGDFVGQRVRVEGRFMTNQAYEGGTTGRSGAAGEPATDAGGDAERPGGMAAAGASMPLQQLAAENIEQVEGACGTGDGGLGADPEPAR